MRSQLPSVCGPLGHRDTVLRAPMGLSIARRAAGSLQPPNVTGLFAFVISDRSKTVAGAWGGTGDSFAALTAGVGDRRQIHTDAAGLYANGDIGRRLNIAGSGAGNNGNFYLSNIQVAPTQGRFIRPVNAGGIEASYTGAYALSDKYSQIIDLKNLRVFSNPTIQTQPARITEFGTNYSCFGKAATTGGGVHSWLECSDAAITGFQGVDISFAARLRIETENLSGGQLQIAALTRAAFPTTSNLCFRVSSSRLLQMTWAAAGTTTFTATATTGALAYDTWYTVGMRLNRAAGTCTFFLDGVNKETTGAGTIQNPLLDRISIGESIGLGSGTSGAFTASMALAPNAWSDAEFLSVHNSFLAYGLPT